MSEILFNTANLVGRATGYRFQFNQWGEQERKTIEATTEAEFAAICGEICKAGFTAVELWMAHCHPSAVTAAGAKVRRKIAGDHGLTVHSVAGPYTEENLLIAEALGAGMINGGFWGTDIHTVKSLTKGSHIGFNFENHAAKTPAEIVARIDGGTDKVGVALDTGWVATSSTLGATEFVEQLGPLVRHVHVKDVAAHGAHHTVPLGAGCVGVDAVLRLLNARGYAGALSWEDEPEDRNPLEIADAMRKHLLAHT